MLRSVPSPVHVLVSSIVALSACSSDDPAASGAPGASGSDPFAAYCTGKLLVDKNTQELNTNTMGTAPAGTTFYVGNQYPADWLGYIVDAGVAKAIASGTGAGLVKGQDFSSDCATDAKASAERRAVLLLETTFYATTDFTGASCVFAAGTEMTKYSIRGDVAAMVSSAEIRAKCGWDVAYAKNLAWGTLIPK